RYQRAFARLTLDGNRPGVRLDHPFHDAQSQAAAATLARARFVYAVKAIKDAGKLRCRNPYSRIRDGKSALLIPLRAELNSDLSSFGCVLDGVFERVAEHLPEPEAVTSDFNWLDIFHDQTQVACFRIRAQLLAGFNHQIRQINDLKIQLRSLRIR